ncbi:MAG TPA: hypothetical protein VLY85_04515, partial [Thermoplasmata archaeon]|nr:hypothetical protein [Thermoplasmata archaeon]
MSYALSWNGTWDACTGSTGPSGGFACSFPIPASVAGSRTLTATDASHDTAGATWTTVAAIRLSEGSGTVGTSIAVSGTGFLAGEPYSIGIDAGPLACSPSGSTNSVGNFTCSFSVPASTGGAHSITATDGTYTATAAFSVIPQVTIAPGIGPAGSTASASGSGFAASVAVSLTWQPGGSTLCSNTSDGSGNFACSFTVPSGTTGSHAVGASDGTNAANASWSLVNLTLSPASGPPGTVSTLGGTGYPSGTFSYCFAPTASQACSTGSSFGPAGGSIPGSTTLVVPTGGSGFVVISLGTLVVIAAPFTETTAILQLSPASGPIGTLVDLSGGGLAPSTVYDYCFGATSGTTCPTTHQFTSSSGGSIPSGTALRAPATSNTFLEISQGSTSYILSAAFTVTTPAVTLSIGGGPVGTLLTITGSGFAGSGAVTVATGSISVGSFTGCTIGSFTIGTIDSDASGAFACAFRISGSVPAGSQAVTATDANSGATASAPFVVSVPWIAVGPTRGPANTLVLGTGTGFAWGGAVTLAFAGSPLGALASCVVGSESAGVITTNATGAFACAFRIPSGAGVGAANLVATDSNSMAAASATFT